MTDKNRSLNKTQNSEVSPRVKNPSHPNDGADDESMILIIHDLSKPGK